MSTAKMVYFRFIFYSLATGLLLFAGWKSRPEETRLFFESWGLWREPILAGLLCGLLASGLGVYILLNRIVFISLGIAQGASFGIFLSFLVAGWFGVSLSESPVSLLAGLAVALGAALLFAWLRRARRVPDESLIGLLYVAASGLTILISDRVAEGHHNIDDLLFGNAVAVTAFELKAIAGITAALFAMHFWFRREFLYTSADPEFMRVRGTPARPWTLLLYFTLTLGITFNLKTLGSLPVFALMVIPPLVSLKGAHGMREAFAVSLLLGAVIPPLGYYFSFIFSFPTGASLIVTGLLFVCLSLLESRLLRGRSARTERASPA
ncbi:MAG: metal ABC transporter permease [bacterium]